MLSHLAAHLTEIKLTLAAMVGITAWLADTSQELDIKGWEELGLKAILLFAVIFIGRLFLDAKREHKAEIQATWDAHKKDVEIREAKLQQCIGDNTKCLTELTALTKEQTEYFKAVTRNVVNEKLNGGKPTLP
jgi:hypothetical protein